uniref:Uncharacterized protein n=1 Tax=Eutreptiella gymnastica TaxID=73025 RepID=A0A6T1ZMS2_9EUGL
MACLSMMTRPARAPPLCDPPPTPTLAIWGGTVGPARSEHDRRSAHLMDGDGRQDCLWCMRVQCMSLARQCGCACVPPDPAGVVCSHFCPFVVRLHAPLPRLSPRRGLLSPAAGQSNMNIWFAAMVRTSQFGQQLNERMAPKRKNKRFVPKHLSLKMISAMWQ